MKRTIQSLVLVLALAFVMPGMQSCKKYEEGPAFSLRTKKARLVNKWKVTAFTVNDNNALDLVKDYTYEFKDDNTVVITDGSNTTEGTWEFSDDKSNLIVNTGGSADSWTIMRLKNDELIVEYTDENNNQYRAEYEPA